MVRGGAGESRRGFIVIFLFESLDLCFLVVVEVIAVLWLSCDRGFMCGTWPRCLFVFLTCSSLRCICTCCFQLGACFFFDLQDWWVDQHGNHTWHVPPKPRNRFPTQSVLRTCLGTSYLVGIILIVCGQFNAASRWCCDQGFGSDGRGSFLGQEDAVAKRAVLTGFDLFAFLPKQVYLYGVLTPFKGLHSWAA